MRGLGLGKNNLLTYTSLALNPRFTVMPLAFAVCIFYYAIIRYDCVAVAYDMHASSLILEFSLVSSIRLQLLPLVVSIMLSYYGAVVAHSYFLVNAHLFSTWRREREI